MAVILRYPTKFGSFGTNYVKIFEDIPVLSAIRTLSKIWFLAIYNL